MDLLDDNIFLLSGKSQKSITRGIGAANTIFVKSKKESLIIDPGVWTHQYKIFKQFAKKGLIDISSIRKVCITHQHWDHATLAIYFQVKYGAEVYCHEKAKLAIENEDIMLKNFFRGYNFLQKEMEKYPMWLLKAVIRFMWGTYEEIKINKTLKEGEEFDYEFPIQIIELPGHTPDNIGFYFPEQKLIATGDLIDLETGIGFDLNNPLSCYEIAKESLIKLSTMNIETLVSGHGNVVRGGEECQILIKNRIAISANLREKIVQILLKEEITLRKLISKITSSNSFIDYLLNKHVIYCYLESINTTEKLYFNRKHGKIFMSL